MFKVNMGKFKELDINLIIVYVNLFFCFSNFFGIGIYLFVFGAILHFLYIFYMENEKKNMLIKNQVILQVMLVILFITTYEIIKYNYISISIIKLVYHIFIPIISFIYGFFSLKVINKSERINLVDIILFIILCMFFHGMLNVIYEIFLGMPNLKNPNARYIIDIWSGKYITATIQNSYIFFTLSFIPISLFYKRYNVYLRLFLLSMFGISLIVSFIIASRTFLFGFLLVASLCIMFFLKEDVKKFSKWIVIVFLLGIGIYMFNLLNFRTFVNNSFLYQRLITGGFNVLNDPRINTWIEVLSKLFKYPFGGVYELSTGLRYAHSLWLDVAHTSGIIPFILLIIIVINMIYCLYNQFNKNKNDFIVISFFVTLLLLICSLEPIIEGYNHIFILFFFVYGLLNSADVLVSN